MLIIYIYWLVGYAGALIYRAVTRRYITVGDVMVSILIGVLWPIVLFVEGLCKLDEYFEEFSKKIIWRQKDD